MNQMNIKIEENQRIVSGAGCRPMSCHSFRFHLFSAEAATGHNLRLAQRSGFWFAELCAK